MPKAFLLFRLPCSEVVLILELLIPAQMLTLSFPLVPSPPPLSGLPLKGCKLLLFFRPSFRLRSLSLSLARLPPFPSRFPKFFRDLKPYPRFRFCDFVLNPFFSPRLFNPLKELLSFFRASSSLRLLSLPLLLRWIAQSPGNPLLTYGEGNDPPRVFWCFHTELCFFSAKSCIFAVRVRSGCLAVQSVRLFEEFPPPPPPCPSTPESRSLQPVFRHDFHIASLPRYLSCLLVPLASFFFPCLLFPVSCPLRWLALSWLKCR